MRAPRFTIATAALLLAANTRIVNVRTGRRMRVINTPGRSWPCGSVNTVFVVVVARLNFLPRRRLECHAGHGEAKQTQASPHQQHVHFGDLLFNQRVPLPICVRPGGSIPILRRRRAGNSIAGDGRRQRSRRTGKRNSLCGARRARDIEHTHTTVRADRLVPRTGGRCNVWRDGQRAL